MINLQILGWPVEREITISVFQIQESERKRHLLNQSAEGRQHSQRGVFHSLGVQLLVLLLHLHLHMLLWRQHLNPHVFNSSICYNYRARQLNCYKPIPELNCDYVVFQETYSIYSENLFNEGRKWRWINLLFPRVFNSNRINSGWCVVYRL